MNKRLLSKSNMYETVQKVFGEEQAAFAVLPGFAENVSAFEEYLSYIVNGGARQSYSGVGNTITKTENRVKLEEIATQVSAKVKVFAKYNADHGLADDVDYTLSSFRRLSVPKLLNATEAVYIRANENLPNMEGFHLEQAELDTFRACIDAYRSSSALPRLNRIDKKLSNQDLQGYFDSADEALAKVDNVIELIRYSNPALYNRYKSARKLELISSRYITLKGSVTDASGASSIAGALLTFVEMDSTGNVVGDDPTMTKSSAGKGGFQVKTLEEGTYKVTAAKVGFKDWEQTLYVNGTNPDLMVRMEAL